MSIFQNPRIIKKTHPKSPKSLFKSRRHTLRFSGDFSGPRAQQTPINGSRLNRHINHIHQNGRATIHHGFDLEEPAARRSRPDPDDLEEDGPADSFFHWEEEDTLFSDLMDELPQEEEDLSHLAESLQAGFEHRGRQLKKDIADTFVPTVNRVKKLYCVIDDKVDLSFGQGLVMYNTACKDAEAVSEQDQDDFQRTYNHHRDKIKDLFAQVEDAYAAHALLGPEFDAALCAIIDPALEVLENAPQKWEQTITHLEKRSNLLEKTDSELAEKKMKGLLSKLV